MWGKLGAYNLAAKSLPFRQQSVNKNLHLTAHREEIGQGGQNQYVCLFVNGKYSVPRKS